MEREQYYRAIVTYRKRRVELKRKFNETKKEKYRNWYQGLTRKISYWNYAIRRLDERKEKIRLLIKCVNDYFDVDIRSRSFDAEHKHARRIYYKVGMETRLRGVWLTKAIGRGRCRSGEGRKFLTKSFATDKKARESFYQFKKYFEAILNNEN